MKQMKKLAVMLACLLTMVMGWSTSVFAAVELEGAAYVGVFDKYLWRGFDLSGSQSVAQGGLDLSAGGFTLSAWGNYQLSKDSREEIDAGLNEVDLTLDYSFDLCEMAWVSLGNIFYNIKDADDTNEAYLSVGLNTLLNPSLTVYWDWDKSDADGLFYVVSVGHDMELSETLSLSLAASAGYNQENYSVDESYSDWHNAEFSLSLDYAVTEQFSLTPSFIYSMPLSRKADDSAGIDDETAAGLTVTFSF